MRCRTKLKSGRPAPLAYRSHEKSTVVAADPSVAVNTVACVTGQNTGSSVVLRRRIGSHQRLSSLADGDASHEIADLGIANVAVRESYPHNVG